jgi:hypothetical protein
MHPLLSPRVAPVLIRAYVRFTIVTLFVAS